MSSVDSSLFSDLQARGLVAQTTGGAEFASYLSEARTLYCGFDPTASSLHIGHLVPLLVLRRFQQAGHHPIALVGGATGLIGDPSFKDQERSLNSEEVVAEWVESIKSQLSQFVAFDGVDNPARLANNLDWMGEMTALSFLRDIGKHFSVSNMINKESVRQRIQREGEGISFTEFSYMILQSLDFAELYKRYNCTLQIGGSDQWGNITGGVDLVRRLHGGTAQGLTLPLVTKADGAKFGKTEGGTVWLDPQRTSPYAFYQFWLNTADADVYTFLRYFTFLSVDEIAEIEAADAHAKGRPEGARILAREVTELVHGTAGLEGAVRITRSLFENSLEELSETDIQQLQLDGLPSSRLSAEGLREKSLTQIFSESGAAASGRQVKDALSRGGVSLNGRALTADENMQAESCFAPERAFFGRYFLARIGKRTYHLFELDGR